MTKVRAQRRPEYAVERTRRRQTSSKGAAQPASQCRSSVVPVAPVAPHHLEPGVSDPVLSDLFLPQHVVLVRTHALRVLLAPVGLQDGPKLLPDEVRLRDEDPGERADRPLLLR